MIILINSEKEKKGRRNLSLLVVFIIAILHVIRLIDIRFDGKAT